jgi:hypothetical protein
MQNVGLILLVFAFVFACIAARWSPIPNTSWHLGWLAIAFWVASELIGGLGRVIH